jgi:hypothetical protein
LMKREVTGRKADIMSWQNGKVNQSGPYSGEIVTHNHSIELHIIHAMNNLIGMAR